MELISETLRLELAPFNVKVITCVTGVVKTNIMSNSAKHDLPTGSIYAPVADKIAERANGEDVKDASTPTEFAKRLVNDILGGASGKVNRGRLASITPLISTFLPTSTLASLFPSRASFLVLRLMSGLRMGYWPRVLAWINYQVTLRVDSTFKGSRVSVSVTFAMTSSSSRIDPSWFSLKKVVP